MGLFKQMKDMKGVVETAPDMIKNAQAMSAQAQEMQIAQQAAAQQAMVQQAAAMPVAGASGAATATFGGVTMEQYATVCKHLNNAGGSPDQGTMYAAGVGISAEAWAEAETGFASLMQTDPTAGGTFRQFYDAAV